MTLAEPDAASILSAPQIRQMPMPMARWTLQYKLFKRFCDIAFGTVAIPAILIVAAALLVLNPILNRGPLFFRQERIGLWGQPFMIWKFRTMTHSEVVSRAHDAPLELERITRLGRFLRLTRIDELPNFLNVLAGDMALVGPRPDAANHAAHYARTVPFYRDRFRVRPGITGLAQVRNGYAESADAVRRKARLDRYYVNRSSGRVDLYIILATLGVMLFGTGAK